MHEFSVMTDVVEALLEECEKNRVERVQKIFLEVGELTFLGTEQMRFAFDVLSKDTVLEGAEMLFETAPALVKCSSCGYEGKGNYRDSPEYHQLMPNFSCPKCGEPSEVISGKECIIRRMVADVEE